MLGMASIAGGTVEFDEPEPGWADRPGELGSITKTLTALALCSLVLDGVVGLDDPLPQGLLPGVTLRLLADHTAGLPRLPANLRPDQVDMLNPYKDYSPADLVDACRAIEVGPLPAEREYSNFGYMVLGWAVGELAGAPVERLIVERVAQPLGLGLTYMAKGVDRTGWLAGHSEGNEVPYWDNQIVGAGGIVGSLRDLAGLGLALLAPDDSALAKPLRLMLDEGLGVVNSGGLVWHNGGTGGFRTFVGVVPENGIGVATLSNSADEDIDAAVAARLRELLTPT